MPGKSKAGKFGSNSSAGDGKHVGSSAAPTESLQQLLQPHNLSLLNSGITPPSTKLNSSNSKPNKGSACRPSSLLLPSSASRRSRSSKAGRRFDPVDVPVLPESQVGEHYAPKLGQTNLFPGSPEDGLVESSFTDAEGDNHTSHCHHFGFGWKFQAPGWAQSPRHPKWLFYILTLVLLVNLLFVLVELRAGARVY